MTVAIAIAIRLARKAGVNEDDIYDLSFLLILGGLIGARIYDVFLEYDYYASYPLEIFKIWKGGLAIHGAIIAGLIILIFFARKKSIGLLKLSSIIVLPLAIGQAIGRFGNYFNQELFGRPTELPWGIPINLLNRPSGFESFQYFHPTFLYESIGLLIISVILLLWIKTERQKTTESIFPLSFYVLSYSLLRFSLEFIKIDSTPEIIGLRWPQIMSLLMIGATIIFIISKNKCLIRKRIVSK